MTKRRKKGKVLPPKPRCPQADPTNTVEPSRLYDRACELAQFLGKAGYDVRHFYARHLPWGVGKVEQPPPFASEALDFDDGTWQVPAIQARFRQAVDAFAPDYVIITDSWNIKPLLAEAV